jgi:hypothetical protein
MTSATDVVPENPEGGRRQSKLAEVRQFSCLGFKLAGLEGDWLKIKISNPQLRS